MLTITWNAEESPLVVLMLNPSTADEFKNDPTVERCEQRARRGGYGGLVVLNIFAFRGTDPKSLYTASDPIGPANDRAIELFARGAGSVIAGWGKHGAFRGRGTQVRENFRASGITMMALKVNADGSPAHPLYIAYDQQPMIF